MKYSQIQLVLATCVAGASFTSASALGSLLGKAAGALKNHHPSTSSLKKVGSSAKKTGSSAVKAAGGGTAVVSHVGSIANYAASQHQIHEQQKLAAQQAGQPVQRRSLSNDEIDYIVARWLVDELEARGLHIDELD